MNRTSLVMILIALVTALGLVFPSTTAAQSGSAIRTQAQLVAPDDAPDSDAKGKAKTQYIDNGNKVQERLTVSAQKLERNKDYQILVDGISLGEYRVRGNSGTLNAKFRDTAKGNQIGLPTEVAPVKDLQRIDIVEVTSGTLVLTGMFEPLPQ